MKRFAEAELLVDSTLEYYSFYDDRVKRKELEYLGLSAAFLDHNFRKAYDYIRSDKSIYSASWIKSAKKSKPGLFLQYFG